MGGGCYVMFRLELRELLRTQILWVVLQGTRPPLLHGNFPFATNCVYGTLTAGSLSCIGANIEAATGVTVSWTGM